MRPAAVPGDRELLVTTDTKEDGMGLFEENPWLLVPIIIVTTECWTLLKSVLSDFARRRRQIEP